MLGVSFQWRPWPGARHHAQTAWRHTGRRAARRRVERGWIASTLPGRDSLSPVETAWNGRAYGGGWHGKGPPAWHIFPPRLGCPAVIRQEMEQASGQHGNLCPLAFHRGSGLHCVWSEYRDRTKHYAVPNHLCSAWCRLPACLRSCGDAASCKLCRALDSTGQEQWHKRRQAWPMETKNGRHMCHAGCGSMVGSAKSGPSCEAPCAKRAAWPEHVS